MISVRVTAGDPYARTPEGREPRLTFEGGEGTVARRIADTWLALPPGRRSSHQSIEADARLVLEIAHSVASVLSP